MRDTEYSSKRDKTDREDDETESLLLSVLKNSPDVIYRFNIQTGHYEYMSPAIRTLGFQPEELMAMSVDEVLSRVHPQDRPALISQLSEINKVGEGLSEYRFRNNNGQYRWWSNKMVIIKDDQGKPLYRDGFVRDITEQKKAEENLTKSQRSSAEAQRIGQIGSWEWNLQTGEISWSDELYHIYGVDTEKFTPTIDSFAKYVHPDDQETITEVINQIITHRTSLEFDFRIISGDGLTHVLKTVAEVTDYDEMGNPLLVIGTNQDVTELNKIEKKLKDERDLLQNVMDGARNSHLVYLDRDFNFVRVNEAYASTCGYKPEEMIGKNHFDLYPHEENEAIFAHVRETGKPAKYHDKPFKFPDQPERGVTYWDWTLTPVKSYDEIIGFIFSLYETTKRKKAEEELKRSEEIYRGILDNLQDAYFRSNNEGLIIMASQSAANIYGFDSPKEMIHLSTSSMYKNREDRASMLECLKKKGKIENYEFEASRKDGSLFYASLNVQFFYDDNGHIQGTECIVRDISHQTEFEETLEKSEEKYRTLFESTSLGVVYQDKHGSIISANPAAEEILGLTLDQMQGRTSTDPRWNAIREDGSDFPGEEHPAMVALKTGREVKNVIMGIYDPIKKSSAWININATPQFKKDDIEPYQVYTIFEDITHKKIHEIELQKTLDELKRSNSELEQFAYVASHDLQEPLRMISSFTQLLERRYKNQLDDDAIDYIHYAVDGAKRMQELINDLLIFSRVKSKAGEFKSVDLDNVIDEVLFNLEIAIEKNDVVIIKEGLPVIFGDYSQMVQVFQNLIGNAIKYRSKKTPKIQIYSKKEDDYWLFSIKDNGIGIESEYFDHIFQIFKRLHSHDEYEGTGIGLAITKRIIDRHDGEIWVESKPGNGSTFYFTIPLKNT